VLPYSGVRRDTSIPEWEPPPLNSCGSFLKFLKTKFGLRLINDHSLEFRLRAHARTSYIENSRKLPKDPEPGEKKQADHALLVSQVEASGEKGIERLDKLFGRGVRYYLGRQLDL
jgi:hypothetical protein